MLSCFSYAHFFGRFILGIKVNSGHLDFSADLKLFCNPRRNSELFPEPLNYKPKVQKIVLVWRNAKHLFNLCKENVEIYIVLGFYLFKVKSVVFVKIRGVTLPAVQLILLEFLGVI